MTNVTMLTFNRPRITQQALDSLGCHEGATVTIRDAGSEASTWESISEWRNRAPANRRACLYAQKVGTGEARNDVIESSRSTFGQGNYLYLSDNDVRFYPSWLDILIECYEKAWHHGYKVIGAYNHPYHQYVGSPLPVYGAYEVREVQALALQSMIMRWEVWDQYGPFEATEPGKVCDGEDVKFCWKIAADGYKIGVVTPALLVNTGITNSFGEKIPGWELVKAQCPPGVICE